MFAILKCSTRAIYACQTCKFKLFFGVGWKHEAAAEKATTIAAAAAATTRTTTTAVAASEKTHEFSRM